MGLVTYGENHYNMNFYTGAVRIRLSDTYCFSSVYSKMHIFPVLKWKTSVYQFDQDVSHTLTACWLWHIHVGFRAADLNLATWRETFNWELLKLMQMVLLRTHSHSALSFDHSVVLMSDPSYLLKSDLWLQAAESMFKNHMSVGLSNASCTLLWQNSTIICIQRHW